MSSVIDACVNFIATSFSDFRHGTAFVFGVLGIIANVLIYQQKSGKKLLLFKLISDCMWVAQYAFLQAWAGAVVSMLGIIRELVFMSPATKGKKRFLAIFLCATVGCTLFTWCFDGIKLFSLLPMAASMIAVYGFWRGDPKLSRILSFPVSTCMIIYDIPTCSVMGFANEILTVISSFVRLLRSDVGHKKKTA